MNWRARVKGENSLCQDLSQKTVAIFREHWYNMGHRRKGKSYFSGWEFTPPHTLMTLNHKTVKILKALSKQAQTSLNTDMHALTEYLNVGGQTSSKAFDLEVGSEWSNGNLGQTQDTDRGKGLYLTVVFPRLQLSFP